MVQSGQSTSGGYRIHLETPVPLGFLIFAAVLVGCGASSQAQQPAASVSNDCDAQYVATVDAGAHLGQAVTVCGKVRDYFYAQFSPDKPTYLLFDAPVSRRKGLKWSGAGNIPDVFSVVIWRTDSKSFPTHFGAVYSGKMLCTTGIVETYDDKPVIVASTPDQIRVGC